MGKAVLTLLILSFFGCSDRPVVVVSGGVATVVPSLTITSAPGSAAFPTALVGELSPGDKVILLKDANASCEGGIIQGSAVSAGTSVSVTSDVWGITSLNHSLRAKVIKQDNSVLCSEAASVTYPIITGATKIVGNGLTMCALLADTSVKCWGTNWNGSLGLGNSNYLMAMGPVLASPLPGTTLTDVIDIDSGMYHPNFTAGHACAVKSDGTVWCWGQGTDGQLGDGNNTSSNIAVQVNGISDAIAVAAGEDHTCVIRDTGLQNDSDGDTVSCWGNGAFGQLGVATTPSASTPVNILPADLEDVISISAGSGFTCAVLDDNTAKCWGKEVNGRLGNGSTSAVNIQETPIVVPGINDAIRVNVGRDTGCVLTTLQLLKCWGANGYGELGNNWATGDNANPAIVPGLSDVNDFQFGQNHVCAVITGGTVKCWGGNGTRAVGNGSSATAVQVPSDVLYISDAVKVGLSNTVSCALDSAGRVLCWGSENEGQTGSGTPAYDGIPRTAAQLRDFLDWFIDNSYTCLTAEDDSLNCLGSSYGRVLTSVTGAANVNSVSFGNEFHCVLLKDKTVECTGDNTYGQLGDNSTNPSGTYVVASGLSNVEAIDTGIYHACALKTDQTLWCWGRNHVGQLAEAIATTELLVPTQVAGLGNVIHFSVEAHTTCAVIDSGKVYCWGFGTNGAIGDGASLDRDAPTEVSGITTATEVTVSSSKACALLADSTVHCWGTYHMGNGVNGSSSTPVDVGISDVAQIRASTEGACVLYKNGEVACWGTNWAADIGDGTLTPSNIPIPTPLPAPAIRLKNAGHRNCAELVTGTVMCWGHVAYSSGGITTAFLPNYVRSQ